MAVLADDFSLQERGIAKQGLADIFGFKSGVPSGSRDGHSVGNHPDDDGDGQHFLRDAGIRAPASISSRRLPAMSWSGRCQSGIGAQHRTTPREGSHW